ncbi:putative metal-dependent protease PAD1/JAB1 superfamily [Clostridium pasteurianum DSM 525 = ATCC 6013]|jgi:proteasome lid subunit RPN8/RPN11|uniref:Mov34/MPN/PAD-1 family protein n=2 Tax=Clostridium pasteurianum TaxID=1501 RepID=A0A0H3JBE5_CLOPA|nr:putative metal-dependent protease PAD1/JAB1 superfamily [Clostridium pasteurianum DSM 525 = ATCC 6013]AJA53578.1 putative metal-dependent protease PAD1/JAB1 superfamily [Clostridium pasteurianum DSM 525 = ATCC 6013]KRU14397.1 Mov34/MPN/PAD-1 family protein [Clostridium pasteurianum DSM 525 = ATCC 6013]
MPGTGDYMIYIEKKEYEKIVEQAKKEFPNECCGFLAGNKDGEDLYIKTVYPLTNIDASSEHFSMDPKEQFKTVKIIRENKMELVGNYHSHPYTPSRPSEEDKRLAFDPKAIYGILSLEKEEPVFNLFKVDKGNVEKLKYEII